MRRSHRALTRVAVGLGVLCVLGTLSRTASADEPPPSPGPHPPLHWDPAWSHAGPWDYALAGAGLTMLVVETGIWWNKTVPPRWNGPILFDTQARDLFRLPTTGARNNASAVSWVLWFGLFGEALAVDVPYAWARYGKPVAWDLFWQDATALSLSAAADFTLRDTVNRLRPYNTQCLDQGGTTAACLNGPEATRSFPSGHMSETTTATALICTQHLMLHLYGGVWDDVTCASAVTADVSVAFLRMMADDHWASDILAGAALGFAFGWGVPVLMHLHGHAAPAPETGAMPVLVAPVPLALDRGGGLGVVGLF